MMLYYQRSVSSETLVDNLTPPTPLTHQVTFHKSQSSLVEKGKTAWSIKQVINRHITFQY